MKMQFKKIKLAYITPQFSAEFGGPWFNLFNELSKYIEVYCIAAPQIHSIKKNQKEESINENFKVIRFDFKKFRLRRELMIPTNLKNILDKINPDIVQSDEFFRFTSTQAAEWADKNKVPFILSSRMKRREGFIRDFAIWIFSKLPKNKFVVTYAKKIISTQGDCSMQEFLRWFPKTKAKFEIIPSGIDIHNFKKKNPGKLNFKEKVILNVSRIDSMKRLDLLMKCFSQINKRFPSSVLVHVGPKNDEREWKKIQDVLNKENIKGKVHFIGPIENSKLGQFYNSADVLVNTSVGEGICFSFLEAMCYRVPIVAFNQGGNYCSITNRESGFLINDNNVKDFTDKVISILKNKKLKSKLGKGAWKRVNEEFDIRKNAQEYIKVYEEVLDKIFPTNAK